MKQAQNGCVPEGALSGHIDGCGLAYVAGEQIKLIRRGRTDVWDETFVAAVRQVRCQLAIAHNRKASPQLKSDNLRSEHAHPFTSSFGATQIAFCHNGTIGALTDRANRANVTDSQIFLEALLKDLPRLDAGDLAQRVNDLARQYAETSEKYTSLTALLLSPSHLFGWRLYRPDSPPDWYDRYYTLWLERSEDRIVVASEPVDQLDREPTGAGNGWELLANGKFFAISFDRGHLDVQIRDMPLEIEESLRD